MTKLITTILFKKNNIILLNYYSHGSPFTHTAYPPYCLREVYGHPDL